MNTPPMDTLRIATRRSRLALAQSRAVAEALRSHWPSLRVEEVHVVTRGDRIQDRPLAEVGGKGLFVSEVEAAVARGEADLAVHSLKDVPGDVGLAPGMAILCIPEREDPRDALVGPATASGLATLPTGARLGTGSSRRISQIRRRRPDLRWVSLRGNVDTRIRKVREGLCDAAVLACAGLRRLGCFDAVGAVPLHPEECLPAIGQGLLALEGRSDHQELRHLLHPLQHVPSRLEMEAERGMLEALHGDCHSAIAGLARWNARNRTLSLRGWIGDPRGGEGLQAGAECVLNLASERAAFEAAREMGRRLAESLLQRGARKLLDEASTRALSHRARGN